MDKMILCNDSGVELRTPNMHHTFLSGFCRWVTDLILGLLAARIRNKIGYKRYVIPGLSIQVANCSCT